MIFTKISAKDIFKQIKADAIGKDSHRGVTLTYAWLANQVGHFSLGFIPTILLIPFLIKCFDFDENAMIAAICISTFWLLFELYNFLGPLLAGRKSKAKLVYLPSEEKTVFRPAWGNIAFDTTTDIIFFAIGAFSAAFFMDGNNVSMIVLITLLLAIALPSRYWFLTKMYLQNTYYPFQFRLSQWTFKIDRLDKEAVLRFMDVETEPKHLLIFGAKNTGKTSLSVGISTELSIKHYSCLYTTAAKIYSDFSDTTGGKIRENDLWSWRDCSVLIIDDINPGPPIDDLITSTKFKELLDINSENRKILASKNVIWVLGEVAKSESVVEEWRNLLLDIGISDEKIESIQL